MSTNFRRLTGKDATAEALYDQVALRGAEKLAATSLGPHALMQRAGLAIAQFAMALAPHAKKIWIPCGPGNNGGGGLEASAHLLQWGKEPVVSVLRSDTTLPVDAAKSMQRARDAGVAFVDGVPEDWDFCVDALSGSGYNRPLKGDCAQWVHRMNVQEAPVLAVDVPTGLDPFTGSSVSIFVRAHATLTLLGAKVGLFTADGRDACGDIWLHQLGVEFLQSPCAQINARPDLGERLQNSHKGSYGDVAVVGGSRGMTGAAILAASGALHGGAGRVYIAFLDEQASTDMPTYPELMQRSAGSLDHSALTVVAGCGSGLAIQTELQHILCLAKHLVLDADALNAIADSSELTALLKQRRPFTTVATPHPLEAARLLKTTTSLAWKSRLPCANTACRMSFPKLASHGPAPCRIKCAPKTRPTAWI